MLHVCTYSLATAHTSCNHVCTCSLTARCLGTKDWLMRTFLAVASAMRAAISSALAMSRTPRTSHRTWNLGGGGAGGQAQMGVRVRVRGGGRRMEGLDGQQNSGGGGGGRGGGGGGGEVVEGARALNYPPRCALHSPPHTPHPTHTCR